MGLLNQRRNHRHDEASHEETHPGSLDLGIIHYASDTPYTRAQTLGGMDQRASATHCEAFAAMSYPALPSSRIFPSGSVTRQRTSTSGYVAGVSLKTQIARECRPSCSSAT